MTKGKDQTERPRGKTWEPNCARRTACGKLISFRWLSVPCGTWLERVSSSACQACHETQCRIRCPSSLVEFGLTGGDTKSKLMPCFVLDLNGFSYEISMRQVGGCVCVIHLNRCKTCTFVCGPLVDVILLDNFNLQGFSQSD